MSSKYREQLETWLKGLHVRGGTVFDVGGAQLPVKGRTASFDVEDYAIVDLKEPHQGDTPAYIADLNSAIINSQLNGRADTVFCLEVMEYIFDPMIAIMHLREMLRRGGILYITFPYYYPPHEPHENDCLRYTLEGAKRLLHENGFDILEIIPRHAVGDGHRMLINDNMLRPSAAVPDEDVISMLGYIIKAKRI